MAGGAGTRLWPMSYKDQPKQFQKLIGEKTPFQMSCERLKPAFRNDDIFVVINQAYKDLVIKQVPKIHKQNIILEPTKRDTAPCIALAVIKIASLDPKATIAVLPSDHLIQKKKEFVGVLKLAEKFLEKNPECLVTLGIKPTYPATGYGYIKINLSQADQKLKVKNIYEVESFKEKPNLKMAQKYVKTKKYFWNSGMFIWKAQTILNEFKKHQPLIYKNLLKIQKGLKTKKAQEIINKEYPKMKKISIDYAIMEKAKKVVCIPADLGWSDIGDWKALKDILSKSKDNLIKGKHFGIKTSGCLIYGPKDKLITTIGLKNFIIVATDKALLVCPKEKAQEIKKIVEGLEKKKEKKFL
jgi:mannose-1-phosphate guanylyltransferase